MPGCVACGKWHSGARHDATPAGFCSRACYLRQWREWRATNNPMTVAPSRNCEWCGKVPRGRPPLDGFRVRFCSDECRRDSEAIVPTVEGHALTKPPQFYEGVCMLCGETERWEWTVEQYASQKPRACPRCRGRMFVDREAGARESRPRYKADLITGDALAGPRESVA